jgi:adenylate kinase family enzyme
LNIKEKRRISIVGSIAVGKTTYAKKLSKKTGIPVYHIDSIQYDEKLNIKELSQIRSEIDKIENQDQWIIDGYGPLDMLESRFQKAEEIIFLQRSLLLNFIMLSYRVTKNFFITRKELPPGSSERSYKHIQRQYKTLWSMYHIMRPEMLKLLNKEQIKHKVVFIG